MRRLVSSHPLPFATLALRNAVKRQCSTATGAAAAKTVLPGIDLARRAVSPSQAFPTTWSDAEPLAPTDPRILWREHFSLADDKPYYENIKSGEVTFQIPDGFVTRFPMLYQRSGYTIDERGAVHATEGAAASVSGKPDGSTTAAGTDPNAKKHVTTRQRLAAYGGGGLLWYLIVHNIFLTTIFSCIYFLRIDLVAVARSYGFSVKRSEEVKEVSDVRKRPPFFKTLLLSIVLNKMMVPIQLAFTVATAPLLVKRLEPIAVRLFPKIRQSFQALMKKVKGTA
ncbi:hypothetical protein STCU_03991 [Strigomonas culicis]|uniref:WW domain-containing protein n=1 Tax=Strigomonas culicis TaxID=28005 RepID=S9UPC0_9TRYP|nr:hypothetical protein STCU_05156 [Strigomonas culicis]EPY30589.1 hypothetical protein STCU_03991 [Strigomonas culicis]|eukprot:EPY28388.1 hypothetical protein STCU_05156 [Strigomonas culicis]